MVMKIERGAYVKIPKQFVYETLAESCFVLLGADPHDDMFSLSDERITESGYAGSSYDVAYKYVEWNPLCGTVEFHHTAPKDDSRSYEVSLLNLIKAVENVLQP